MAPDIDPNDASLEAYEKRTGVKGNEPKPEPQFPFRGFNIVMGLIVSVVIGAAILALIMGTTSQKSITRIEHPRPYYSERAAWGEARARQLKQFVREVQDQPRHSTPHAPHRGSRR